MSKVLLIDVTLMLIACTERVCVLRLSTVHHRDIHGGIEHHVAVDRRILIHVLCRRVSILQRAVGEEN